MFVSKPQFDINNLEAGTPVIINAKRNQYGEDQHKVLIPKDTIGLVAGCEPLKIRIVLIDRGTASLNSTVYHGKSKELVIPIEACLGVDPLVSLHKVEINQITS